MPAEVRKYKLEDAEKLPCFLEPMGDELVVAVVDVQDNGGVLVPGRGGADEQTVSYVVKAGPGRPKPDGTRMEMPFKRGDLLHLSARQLATAFSFRGYEVWVVSAQSVSAKINKEELDKVIKRAKAGEFEDDFQAEDTRLEDKYGDGENPKLEVVSG